MFLISPTFSNSVHTVVPPPLLHLQYLRAGKWQAKFYLYFLTVYIVIPASISNTSRLANHILLVFSNSVHCVLTPPSPLHLQYLRAGKPNFSLHCHQIGFPSYY